MLKRALNLLKNNSSILLNYFAYQVLAIFVLFLLYPHNFNDFVNSNTNAFDFIAYFAAVVKMLLAVVIIGMLSVLFLSGVGYMLTEAITTGRTSVKSFLPGIRIYFVRILLSSLLLYGFTIIFSILLGLVTIVVAFALSLNGSISSASWSICIILIITVIIMIPMPFVMLWYPSIFIDNTGVIQGLKNGARAGAKNYWKLFFLLFLMILPMGFHSLYHIWNINGDLFNPVSMVFYLTEALITVVIFPFIFMIYQDYRQSFQTIGMI